MGCCTKSDLAGDYRSHVNSLKERKDSVENYSKPKNSSSRKFPTAFRNTSDEACSGSFFSECGRL